MFTVVLSVVTSCSPMFWYGVMSGVAASPYNSGSYYGSSSNSSWGSSSNQPWNTPTDVNKFAENQRNMTPSWNGSGGVFYGGGSAPSGTTVQSNSNIGSSSSTQGHNSSGKRDCHLCHGTGQCPSCNGSGVIYSFYGDKLDCPNCTNGKCKNCQ